MCGRFTLTQSAKQLAKHFQLEEEPQFVPGYNIAPSQPVPVIRAGKAVQRQFDYLYWGLIPSWSKDPTIGARLINARSETVTEKPSFRAAFKRRRCLIAADGFYEWQQGAKKTGTKKQPFYFQLQDHQPFGFAGLWEIWHSPEGDEVESCTILTAPANEQMQPIHNRMPVILSPDDYDLWLDPNVQSPDRILPLLRPYPDEQMQHYPVSTLVNSPSNDSPDCIVPLEASVLS
jgi:putative SOS response-associated peptidase YedK